MVGLTDHDLSVNDDQSFVATDFYTEQIKTVHVYLAGTGGHASMPGGRVTIAGVKSSCYTGRDVEIDNYRGSLWYSSAFFFGQGASAHVTQRGVSEVNISLVGTLASDGDDSARAKVAPCR